MAEFQQGRRCKNEVPTPNILRVTAPGAEYVCFEGVTLRNGQTLKDQSTVAQVQSIWIPDCQAPVKAVIVLKQCSIGRLVPRYGMREIKRTEHQFTRSVKEVVTVLNVQHNCHKGQCEVTMSQTKMIERKICDVMVSGITHAKTSSFILNSAAHYSGELHRRIANTKLTAVTPEQWNTTIAHGLDVWHDVPRQKKKEKQAANQTNHLDTESEVEQ
ncbi:uncharacterized protein MELLADRAFT_111139 [Melampsora larici-populina 98AG31]|uniref:Uncharacterized protein n=1 Tax=Melampsora larici-populina (strain 98AG31 / pathotype 3-4-7) TaxID=747676 RepID=F4S256_MELLP|nr:uncharacterized protein MELLADRAFT_111139 [Melampsora larici-populina 98AG31]EGG01317.1 hypothetical protein MELLADRAFT_111139 [Melampsora larici-populina 98AG31]